MSVNMRNFATFAVFAAGANAFVPRDTSCCFHITASGDASGSVGQLGDGQNRIGDSRLPAGQFCIDQSGSITDGSGRGCILTPPTTQFQCDLGATPTPGFSVNQNGQLEYNGQTGFVACETGENGGMNIYTSPDSGDVTGCVNVQLMADSCAGSGAGGGGGASSPAPAPSSTPAQSPAPSPSSPGGGGEGPGSEGPGQGTSTVPVVSPSPSGPTGEGPGSEGPGQGTSTVPVISPSPSSPGGGGEGPGSEGPGQGTSTVPVVSPSPSGPTGEGPGSGGPGQGTSTVPIISPSPSSPGGGAGGGDECSECLPTTTLYTTVTVDCSTETPVPGGGGGGETPTGPAGGGETPTGPAETQTPTGPTGGGETPTGPAETQTPTGPAGGGETPTGPAETQTPTGPAGGGETPTGPAETQTPTGPAGGGETQTPTGPSGGGQTPTPSSGSCPADLSGDYEYPHLIIPVDSSTPEEAPGSSFNGTVSSTTSTIFNFDIPPSDAGKTCSLVFLFPKLEDLETSSYSFSGDGKVSFAALESPAEMSTSYSNAPGVSQNFGDFTISPGNSYSISNFECPAGKAIGVEMSNAGNTELEFFEDYNPSPLGLYITVC